jgi:hypothetical protein
MKLEFKEIYTCKQQYGGAFRLGYVMLVQLTLVSFTSYNKIYGCTMYDVIEISHFLLYLLI